MKKFYSTLLIAYLIISCSKDDSINEVIDQGEEEEETVNLPPNNFDVEILNISYDSVTINWSEAIDPENDQVTYSIYLNEKSIIENVSELTHQLKELEELTDYSGKIIAKDSDGNQTEVTFSFQTKKYFLKYLKKYDYGKYSNGPDGYAYGTPYSMIKSKDQNYVITGSCSFNGNGYRFFVSKIDYEGNELWKKFYDYQLGDAWKFKIIESQTGYILVGLYNVLNLDFDGNIIWYRKIDSYDIVDASSEIKSVAQDSEGNIFLVGGRISETPFPSPVQVGVLTKLDSSGNIIWEKIFDSSYRSFFNDILITNNDEIIILGSVESSTRTFEEIAQRNEIVIFGSAKSSHHPSKEIAKGINEQIDFWVLKTNTNGEIIWENTFGDGRYDFPERIITKSNGNYVFAGYSWGAYDISEGRIFEIDTKGSEVWNVSTELSSTFSIAETMDGGFITTGHVDFGNYGALGIYKFSSNGTEEWNKKYQESFAYLYGRSILIEEDGGFRIAGSLSKNYYYGDEKPELLIYKTDPEGNFE